MDNGLSSQGESTEEEEEGGRDTRIPHAPPSPPTSPSHVLTENNGSDLDLTTKQAKDDETRDDERQAMNINSVVPEGKLRGEIKAGYNQKVATESQDSSATLDKGSNKTTNSFPPLVC